MMEIEVAVVGGHPDETQTYLEQSGWGKNTFSYDDLKLNFVKDVSENSQAALIFYDCLEHDTVKKAQKQYEAILEKTDSQIPIVLIGTSHEVHNGYGLTYNSITNKTNELFKKIKKSHNKAAHYQVSKWEYAVNMENPETTQELVEKRPNLSTPLSKLREMIMDCYCSQ